MSIDNWLWRESTWAFNGFCQITDRRIILDRKLISKISLILLIPKDHFGTLASSRD
jgi:hypothetical protein